MLSPVRKRKLVLNIQVIKAKTKRRPFGKFTKFYEIKAWTRRISYKKYMKIILNDVYNFVKTKLFI